MTLDYVIGVPSRKRVHNIPVIRELLPSAIICVDEREAEDYAPVVPAEQLLIHPPMTLCLNVRNWMMDALPNKILILINDDFCGVQVTTGTRRYITDAEEILAILENSARACDDLGLTTFTYSGTPNTTIIRPDERPIVPTQPCFSVIGLMGAARKRKYRPDIPGRADLDWTLRTLLIDRCVYADVRFYFDCGAVFSGRGGNVGLVTPEQFTAASKEVLRTWGNAVSFKGPGYVKHREVASLSIRVSRTNKTAQR